MLDQFIQNDWLEKFVNVFLLLLYGILIMRLVGKKSISQMTFPTFVMTIVFGSILAIPISSEKVNMTMYIVAIMVILLIIIQFSSLKINWFEKLFVGQSVALVENGNINKKNLQKTRITVDQLKSSLRELKVANISDCKTITVEPNGKIGVELRRAVSPITYQDCHDLIDLKIKQLMNDLVASFEVNKKYDIISLQRLEKYQVESQVENQKKNLNLFEEVVQNKEDNYSEDDLK
jgi:uncharacterized membrane protein YcaP (DUF421 family)